MLSVLIPWKNRPELGEALERNTRLLRQEHIEVLVVNHGGDPEELGRLVRGHGWPEIRTIHIGGVPAFNKPECLNIGASLARGETLFVLDADVIPDADFLRQALHDVRSAPGFVSIDKIIESAPEKAPGRWDASSAISSNVVRWEITVQSGHVATAEFRMTNDGTRTGPGMIVVDREHFISVQGFNSELRGWGFEDYDLQIRLQLLIGLKRKTMGTAIHLSHPRPAQSDRSNQDLCFQNYKRGFFLGTYDADVARLSDNIAEASR
jgi:predicted glycosyltransferase involved in capsule biosynthesis